MVFEIFAGTNIVLISIAFLVLALIGFFIIIFQLWTEGASNALVKNLTYGAIVISFGYVLSITNIILGELYWLGITHQSNFYLMLSLSFYYAGWFLGLRLLLKKTFRLPEERKRRYSIFMNVMIGLVLLMLVFTFTTRTLVNKMGENNPIVIGLFITQGVLGLIVFIVFKEMIKAEINKTASKLTKARFYVLHQVIIVQLVTFGVIIIGDILELIFIEQLLIYEVFTIVILSLLSLLTVWMLHGIVYVPEGVKERFGIMQTRFETIKQIVTEEDND